MKARLLQWLVCPMCGDANAPLTLQVWREADTGGEIEEGLLNCAVR
jgi:uncharacterized protein YbaR (Trm112 family)